MKRQHHFLKTVVGDVVKTREAPIMKLVIKNARILTPHEILKDYGVVVENGKIKDIAKSSELEKDFDKIIDAQGNYLAPGFIDIHNHGNFGHDVMEATPEALDSIASFHIKNGVTSFLATTMTASKEEIERALQNIRDHKNSDDKAKVLGVYLEGPFFSSEKKGAQAAKHLRNPDIKLIDAFIKASGNTIKIVALAPELPGARELIAYLKKQDITTTLAHTNADYVIAKDAINAGAILATHVFNAMKSFSHREPGVVGAVLADDRVFCEMICDAIHLHPATMKLVEKAKGPERLILVSDAMMAAGLSDGDYSLGGQRVIVKNGEARLQDGTLAGSILTLNRAVYNMINLLGVSLKDAVKMATLNPAKAIGIDDKKGSIEIGKDADIIIFDENINILKVILGGKILQ